MEKTISTLEHESRGVGNGLAGRRAVLSRRVRKMDAYWRAANYLSVGQIYLYDNPLLRDRCSCPCQAACGRTLGHDTGSKLYLCAFKSGHQKIRPDMFYIAGPGHGGPALVGNTYLEGTYSEIYPNITPG